MKIPKTIVSILLLTAFVTPLLFSQTTAVEQKDDFFKKALDEASKMVDQGDKATGAETEPSPTKSQGESKTMGQMCSRDKQLRSGRGKG